MGTIGQVHENDVCEIWNVENILTEKNLISSGKAMAKRERTEKQKIINIDMQFQILQKCTKKQRTNMCR